MPIEVPTQNEINELLGRAENYYKTLLDSLHMTGYPPDFERLLHSDRVYGLVFPTMGAINGRLRDRDLVTFLKVGGVLRMELGKHTTPLYGDVYFIGRRQGDPGYTPAYWKGEAGRLTETLSDAAGNASLSRLHIALYKPDEGKIVLADVGTNPLILVESW